MASQRDTSLPFTAEYPANIGPTECSETMSSQADRSEVVLINRQQPAEDSEKGSDHSPQADTESSTDSGHDDDLDDFDMDTLQTHCKCPCGSTSLLHCVKPPPACLIRRYSNPGGFPELDLTRGPDKKKARSAMRQYLSSETGRIKDLFTVYGMAVYHLAKSIAGIDMHLKQILRLGGREYADLAGFDEIYNAVTEGVNFLYPEPLKTVLEECNHLIGDEECSNREAAKRAAKRYEEAFKNFVQLRVFSFVDGLRELRPPIQEGFYNKLKVKVEENFRTFIVNRIYHFKTMIRELLEIPDKVFLRVADVKEGCIEITFEVMGKVDDKVFEMDTEKKRVLASNKISMLEYGGKVYYCCCNLYSDEESEGALQILYEGASLMEDEDGEDDHLSDEDDHMPDCPSLKDKSLKCPLDECRYCGVTFLFCFLEIHSLECEKRPNVCSSCDTTPPCGKMVHMMNPLASGGPIFPGHCQCDLTSHDQLESSEHKI